MSSSRRLNANGHLGLDLGGTKIEAVMLSPGFADEPNPAAAVEFRERIPTESGEGYEALIERVAGLIARAEAAASRPATIGVGHPGILWGDPPLVKNANTTCLNGKPLGEDLSRRLGRAVAFENDANCLALAEARWGAGRGASVVFGAILGTGVGGGIVVDGRVHRGRQGIAGEWGHNRLVPDGRACYCGRRGCVETVLSGPGLEATIRDRLGSPISAEAFNLAVQQDEAFRKRPEVRSILENYLNGFGRALSQVINILDPDVVVIGGGLSRMPFLYSDGPKSAAPYVFSDGFDTPIRPAALGDAAGVFGAAGIGAGSARQR